jgi:hypothetical protein
MPHAASNAARKCFLPIFGDGEDHLVVTLLELTRSVCAVSYRVAHRSLMVRMKFTAYENTATAPALRWVTPIHTEHSRGYGYQTGTHFVHFYGKANGIWVISPGLCVTQGNSGTLQNWQASNFGATNSVASILDVGQTIAGVWRPGILRAEDIRTGLLVAESDQYHALQAVRILLERLDDLFLYVEPTPAGLATYGHKTRELLILASTEVENAWARYLTDAGVQPIGGARFTTNDYVRLHPKLHLAEYQLVLNAYPSVPASRPFDVWASANPTQSLPWYHAYNLTKHDRRAHFDKATLRHCIDAVAASLILFATRFSPYPLFNSGGTASALFNQLFQLELVHPRVETFYVPMVQFPANPNLSLSKFDIDAVGLRQPWQVQPFTV